MKSFKITTILLFEFLWILGFSQPDKAFDKANQYYQNQEYTKAIQLYDSLLNSGLESYEIYFNLGNSHFKKEDYAKAILYFEKAKKIDPSDEDLEYNLSLANERITDKIKPVPTFILKQWWYNFVDLLTERLWTVINLIFWAIAMFLGYLFFTSSRSNNKKTFFWLGITMLIISFITGLAGFNQYQNTSHQKTAIVMTPTVNIKSSPSEKSSSIFVIHQGTKVNLKVKIKDWYQIKLANGNQGWIKVEDVEKI